MVPLGKKVSWRRLPADLEKILEEIELGILYKVLYDPYLLTCLQRFAYHTHVILRCSREDDQPD